MNRRLLFALTLAPALSAWPAPTPAAEIYMSADEYMMASKPERWGFVQGVYDTYGALARPGNLSDATVTAAVGRIVGCTEKISVNELERTFTGWLDAHPDRWNERMPTLFLSALDEHCTASAAPAAQDAGTATTN